VHPDIRKYYDCKKKIEACKIARLSSNLQRVINYLLLSALGSLKKDPLYHNSINKEEI
jgi:hypothetical protein